MGSRRCQFYKEGADVLRIPAFVTRIDKSKAARRYLILPKPQAMSDGKSPYFESDSDASNQPMKSSLLEHEAIEYGYHLKSNSKADI